MSAFPGLEVERFPWHVYYSGTKEALINAGLVDDGMFPGDPGRGKTMVTYRPDGTPWHGGPKGLHIRRRSRNLFEVKVDLTPDEIERRAMDDKADRVKAELDALADLFRALDPIPRAQVITYAADLCRMSNGHLPTSNGRPPSIARSRVMPNGWRVIEGQRAT